MAPVDSGPSGGEAYIVTGPACCPLRMVVRKKRVGPRPQR